MMHLLRPLILAACLGTAVPGALAGPDDDQERVWEARKRGDILPLEDILAKVLRLHPGEVLEIELDDDDGELIYEIEVLTRRGIVLEMDVDARTGKILKLEEDD